MGLLLVTGPAGALEIPAPCSFVRDWLVRQHKAQEVRETQWWHVLGQGNSGWIGLTSCMIIQSDKSEHIANVAHLGSGEFLLGDVRRFVPNWRDANLESGTTFFVSSSPVSVHAGKHTWAAIRSHRVVYGEVGSLRIVDEIYRIDAATQPVRLGVFEGHASGDGGEFWLSNHRFSIDDGQLIVRFTDANHEPRFDIPKNPANPAAGIDAILATRETVYISKLVGSSAVPVSTTVFTGLTTLTTIDWNRGSSSYVPLTDYLSGQFYESDPRESDKPTGTIVKHARVRIIGSEEEFPFQKREAPVLWRVETSGGRQGYVYSNALERLGKIIQ